MFQVLFQRGRIQGFDLLQHDVEQLKQNFLPNTISTRILLNVRGKEAEERQRNGRGRSRGRAKERVGA